MNIAQVNYRRLRGQFHTHRGLDLETTTIALSNPMQPTGHRASPEGLVRLRQMLSFVIS